MTWSQIPNTAESEKPCSVQNYPIYFPYTKSLYFLIIKRLQNSEWHEYRVCFSSSHHYPKRSVVHSGQLLPSETFGPPGVCQQNAHPRIGPHAFTEWTLLTPCFLPPPTQPLYHLLYEAFFDFLNGISFLGFLITGVLSHGNSPGFVSCFLCLIGL